MIAVIGLIAVLALSCLAGALLARAYSDKDLWNHENKLTGKLFTIDAVILVASMITAWGLDMPFTIAFFAALAFVIFVAILINLSCFAPVAAREALSKAGAHNKKTLQRTLERTEARARISNDVLWASIPGLLLCLAIVALTSTPAQGSLAMGIAIFCDAFLVCLLVATGIERKQPNSSRPFLPYVTGATIILLMLFGAIIASFAAMYLSSGVLMLVRPHVSDCADGAAVTLVRDAIYYSMGSMTWHPTPDICLKQDGRWMLIFEVSSGFLVLLFAIPVLTRRIGSR